MTGSSNAIGASAFEVLGIGCTSEKWVSPSWREKRPHDVRPPRTSRLPADRHLGRVNAERPRADRATQVSSKLGVSRFNASHGVAHACGDRGTGALGARAGTPGAAAQAVGRRELFDERLFFGGDSR